MTTPTRVYLVCGDCRVRLEAHGATLALDVETISLGALCEAHPAPCAPQASSAVRWIDPDAAGIPTAPPTETAAPSRFCPKCSTDPCMCGGSARGIGPVTELAARLLCAMVSGEGGTAIDSLAIGIAVDRATDLLSRTQGR